MTFQEWLKTEAGRMVSFEEMPRMLEIVWNSSAEAAEARAAELQIKVNTLRAERDAADTLRIEAEAERDETAKELLDLRKHHADIIMSLYAIDHDVFGPLTSIEGIAELLRQRDEARRQIAGYNTLMTEASVKIDELHEQLEQAQARIAQLERENSQKEDMLYVMREREANQ